jgi:hypothetical protein
MAPKCLRQKP